MTSSIGFTSDVLDRLRVLSTIAKTRPALPTGQAKKAWDGLLAINTSVAQAVVSQETSSVNTIIDDIKTWIQNTIGGIQTWIQNNVVGVINSISTSLSNGVNSIISKVEGVVGDVIEGVNNALGSIGDTLETVIGWIIDKLSSIIEALSNIGRTIGDIVLKALTDVIFGLNAIMQEFGRSVASWLGGIINEVREWFGGVIEGIKTAWNNVTRTIGEWVTNAYNTVRGAIEGVVSNIVSTYESVKKSVEDWIATALEWVQGVKESVVKWFWETLTKVGAWIKTDVIPKWDNLVEGAQGIWKGIGDLWGAIEKGDYVKALDVVNGIFTGIGIPAPIKIVHTIVSALAYFWETVHLQFVGMEVSAQKQAIINLALESVPLDAAAQALFKGETTESAYYKNAALSGIPKERARLVLEATKALPTPGSVQEAYLRGTIGEQEHDKLLRSFGYSDDNIDLFKSLYFLIPPPQDLIRMGVREVFTPEIAEKFGQFQDIPKAFLEWGKKIGLSETWSKNYWAAHWELPSASMGFEMLHRGVIDDDELKLLLRALDVMPFWRERLIEISYNPLTRVDVRRMYQLGVLDESQVTRAYLDLGYNQEKAEWLTEFTRRYYAPEDQTQLDEFHNLARGVYSQAYKKKIISRDEYKEFLVNLKYHPEDVELLVQLDDFSILQSDRLFDPQDMRVTMRKLILSAYNDGLVEHEVAIAMLEDLDYERDEAETELSVVDYNRELSLRSVIVEAMHTQFIGFMIDEVGLHELMGMFNFSGLEIDRLVQTWNVERSFRTKRPALGDLRKFLSLGLFTLDEFLDELRGLGYHEKYVNLYRLSIEKGQA